MSHQGAAQLTVELQYNAAVNGAMQQNHVPAVRALHITNNTGLPLAGLVVTLHNNLNIWPKWQVNIDQLDAGASWHTQDLPLSLNWEVWSTLTESQQGSISLTIQQLPNQNIIFESEYPLSLLPLDHWQGINVLPELLAAFVTPNLPAIAHLLKEASLLVAQRTGDPSLNDYQTQDINRVRQMMAAIYDVLQARQITYVTVPPSFEEQGQRVRLPDKVLEQQMGNCLDMSLLYAACLEAAGLHPILVVIKGHAFAGCWLMNDTFTDAAVDDPSMLTKRVAAGIHELTLTEATAMNAGKKIAFEEAENLALENLANPDNFILAIDVKRARFGGVRPLPVRILQQDDWQWHSTAMPADEQHKGSTLKTLKTGEKLLTGEKLEVGRRQIWERKLLDLTLRNSLLNMRVTQQSLQLLTANLSVLEDKLSAGDEFNLLPRPADWDGEIRSSGLYEAMHANNPLLQLAERELMQNRLRCYLPEAGFYENLLAIYRKAKLAMEENGANTLFLALGILRWYETAESQRPRFAPIMLVPVEMVRRGNQKGFVIRSREEEAQINITLLEMLRQDFGITVTGLEKLPGDDQGVDVQQVLYIIRQLIMPMPRWDVEEQALIGHFSFSKFVMWRDIHAHADLLARNPVVDSLLQNRLTWQPVQAAQREHDIDNRWHAADLLLPISADSSQLQAIGAALSGESFVLHGPPGTGKSQTITNIIANALYRGKRVLFVAEKMAALEVVEKRLESIGIGTYCLELHSNKARKTEVLQQLKAITDRVRTAPAPTFQQEAERLQQMRQHLNAYLEAMHSKGAFGLTLFEAVNAWHQLPEAIPALPMPLAGSEDAALLATLHDDSARVQTAAVAAGIRAGHPLQPIGASNWSKALQEEAGIRLAQLATHLGRLQDIGSQLCHSGAFGSKAPAGKMQWDALRQWASVWLQAPAFPVAFLQAAEPLATWQNIAATAALGIDRDRLRQELRASFNESVLTLPAEQLQQQLLAAGRQWFLPRWWKQRKIKRVLAGHSPTAQVDADKVHENLTTIIKCQKLQQQIIQAAAWLQPLLGPLWQQGEVHWGTCIAATGVLQHSWQCAQVMLPDVESRRQWRQQLAVHLQDGTADYVAENKALWQNFLHLWQLAESEQNWLHQNLQWQQLPEDDNLAWLPKLQQQVNAALAHIGELRAWCMYRYESGVLAQKGYGAAVSRLEQEGFAPHHWQQAFLKGIYEAVANRQMDQLPALSRFSSQLYTDAIHRFGELLNHFQQLSRQQIAATVGSRIPSLIAEAAKGTEVAILQKAIANNGRGISIRQLFEQIPNLLPRLAPCMLMSPISVAQYLSLNLEPFDLIIFDEASQMPTSEAIGALARGRQVVVVGDPKQMPPTSFFAAQQFDEEQAAQEDLESILDDCLALPMPGRYLQWHYRSRHESLIAFSNARYYEHKLLTFPSADDIASKVTLVPVDGYYDRSRARHNVAEANAIVAEVLHRLQQTQGRQSLGIVTFSSVQQQLIQKLMDEAFDRHPQHEAWALQAEEPLFIKNLENVQGDERDVILFSVGYGPDKEGKVYMNFGPINREGGWRRLNVAVSRSRYEMKVFSSLRAAHLQLARSSGEGVAGLRAFLEYAEKGKMVLQPPAALVWPKEAVDSAIADIIEAAGHRVNAMVGASGFKVDLAVVHPHKPGFYCLGILLDGPRLAAMSAARDRFVGKVQVLRQLGWAIYRVWLADWWLRKNEIAAEILAAIEQALVHADSPEPVPETTTEPTEPPVLQGQWQPQQAPQPVAWPHREKYEPCQLPPVKNLAPAQFFEAAHKQLIAGQLRRIITQEAPIVQRLLFQKVLEAWGISRIGNRLHAHMANLLKGLEVVVTEIEEQTIIAMPGFDAATYRSYRLPDAAEGSYRRAADELPVPEVANAITELIGQQISMPTEVVLREAARLFGFARGGTQVDKLMLQALKYAQLQGRIQEKNGSWIPAG